MGREDRLRNRVEPLLRCFGLSAMYRTRQHLTLPAITPPPPPYTKNVLTYMVIVGSTLNHDKPVLSLFLSRYVIYLCFKGSRLNVHKFVRKTYRFLKINFFLLQKKYILFVGESTAGIDKIKMCQAIRDKIRVCHLRFCTQGREKGAQ